MSAIRYNTKGDALFHDLAELFRCKKELSFDELYDVIFSIHSTPIHWKAAIREHIARIKQHYGMNIVSVRNWGYRLED